MFLWYDSTQHCSPNDSDVYKGVENNFQWMFPVHLGLIYMRGVDKLSKDGESENYNVFRVL